MEEARRFCVETLWCRPMNMRDISRNVKSGVKIDHHQTGRFISSRIFQRALRLANSSQKLTRPGAGPAAELPSQHTRITATRPLQIAVCVFARVPRQRPCRVGFGTWALAVQLRLKPLGAPCVLTQKRTTGNLPSGETYGAVNQLLLRPT